MTNHSDGKSGTGSTLPVLDLAVLGPLLDDADSDEEGMDVMRRVVASYCSGKLLEEAERSVNGPEWEVLERAAHNLKGLSYTLGAQVVGAVAAELEEASSRRDLACCRLVLPRMATELARAYEALAGTTLYDQRLVEELRGSRGDRDS